MNQYNEIETGIIIRVYMDINVFVDLDANIVTTTHNTWEFYKQNSGDDDNGKLAGSFVIDNCLGYRIIRKEEKIKNEN